MVDRNDVGEMTRLVTEVLDGAMAQWPHLLTTEDIAGQVVRLFVRDPDEDPDGDPNEAPFDLDSEGGT